MMRTPSDLSRRLPLLVSQCRRIVQSEADAQRRGHAKAFLALAADLPLSIDKGAWGTAADISLAVGQLTEHLRI